MDDISSPTITLKRAADAAGLNVRWLRGRVAGCEITMLGQAPRRVGQWNRASVVDVFRLYVLRRFLDCGLTLAEGVMALDLGVDPFLGGLAWCGVPVHSAVLLHRLAGHRLHLIRDAETDDLDVCRGPDTALPPCEDVVITFDLGRLAADALARINSPAIPHENALAGGRAEAGSGHPFNTNTAGAPAPETA